MPKQTSIAVIDGQGGKVGRQIIEDIKTRCADTQITAIGTNSTATAAMMKGGADFGATGENAVVVCCRTADIVVGPIGIVIADSMRGEITPAMAVAIGQSAAQKVLLPINRCDNIVVGVPDLSMSVLLAQAVDIVAAIAGA